ncbi:MAG: hypothetical protein JWM76_331, partial [Pseudonocardiales bacterium]|nr:hypothetical protein [Pseudonocardiales bacterium]
MRFSVPRQLGRPSTVLAFLGALLVFFVAASPARADAVDDAVSSLKSTGIYIQSGAQNGSGKDVEVDQSQVNSAAGGVVKIAILAEGTSTQTAINRMADSLGSIGNIVVVAFSGNKFDAGATGLKAGLALSRLNTAVSSHTTELRAGTYTSVLVDYATTMRTIINAVANGNNGNNGSSSGSGDSSTDSGSSPWPWVAGIGGLAVVGGGGYVFNKRRKTKQAVEAAKSNVMPYYDRLANEVNTINTLDNRTAQQAMADASERYTAAGSQMATAETVQNWSTIRRTTLEGLQASQLARKELGLPPGPELPPVDEARGDQLTAAQQVDVQGQQYQGYPQYTPGAPYYYGGGAGYPGGWYSFPFWETLLIGSVIGGGGWGWGGGGYGSGYNSG